MINDLYTEGERAGLADYERRKDGRNPEYVGVPLFLLNKYMRKCQG